MTRAASSLRIVIMGYVVRGPLAGNTWHHLQYARGLADLGHDVWFLEDSDDWPSCYDPSVHAVGTDPTYGLAYAARNLERFGLGDRWAFHDAMHAGGARWHGPAADSMAAVCASADLLINVSGINPLRPWVRDIPHRVLVDTDPVFTQVDVLNDPERRAFAQAHTAFFSFGESVGLPGCSMPEDGLPWRATRQPVLLDAWQPTTGPANGLYTTVMLWDSYSVREWKGRHYGMKSQEMQHVLAMPARCGPRFELALGGPTAPGDRLLELGWQLRDPLAVTRDPWDYQRYMIASKGEFGVAKHGYVTTASGWFSERSANYMALGRPVVAQDTGFSRHLPTGEGLLAFTTLDEAVAAVAEVDAYYKRHAEAARAVVESHFDSRKVLARLIEQALDSAAPVAPAISPTTTP